MCSPGYHHDGFVATHALGHMMCGLCVVDHLWPLIYIIYIYIYIHVYIYIYIYIYTYIYTCWKNALYTYYFYIFSIDFIEVDPISSLLGLQEIREAFALKLSVAPSQLQLLTTATNLEELGNDEVQVPQSKTRFFMFTNIGFAAQM